MTLIEERKTVISMPTLRDNYAYIESEGIQDISYLPDTANVSEGQPVNSPPTISKNGGEFLISLSAGRHKSSPVADRFSKESGGKGHMFTPFSILDTQPSELNFCFGLKIHWKNGQTTDVWLIKVVGQKMAAELAKLITANVNSFRITT